MHTYNALLYLPCSYFLCLALVTGRDAELKELIDPNGVILIYQMLDKHPVVCCAGLVGLK